MITIVAKVSVKEGKKEDFKQAVKEMISASQAEEGNVSYNLFQDLENPNSMAFIEQWKDSSAIEYHNSTEHFKTGINDMKPFIDGIEITQYTKE